MTNTCAICGEQVGRSRIEGFTGWENAEGEIGGRETCKATPGLPGSAACFQNDNVGRDLTQFVRDRHLRLQRWLQGVGCGFEATDPNLMVYASKPSASGVGWDVSARNSGNSSAALWAHVLCAG